MSGHTSQALKSLSENPSEMGIRVLNAILEEIPQEEMVSAIRGLLTATKFERVGRHETQEMPDHRAREAGAKLMLSYTLGMPVQRTVEVHQRAETDEGSLKRLMESPAARSALRHLLDGAEDMLTPQDYAALSSPRHGHSSCLRTGCIAS